MMKPQFVLKIIILLLALYSVSYSQSKVSGIIVDGKDGKPVNDAAIRITTVKDSAFISGTATDASGKFEISGLTQGKYLLTVSYVGYTAYRKTFEAENGKDIILDTIKLGTKGYVTEEIDVESDIPEMTIEDEKKVFDVQNLSTTRGGTALDVLRKIPMIEVDINDNVSLRGSMKIVILIDNKPMKFSNLRQLPADAIKNVEVITNPSAKYEAEGVTGIININLREKKEGGVGYNGYLYSGARANFETGNLSTGINMNLKKWTFFTDLGFGIFNHDNNTKSATIYDNPASEFSTESSGEGENKYGYVSFGAEYLLEKGHSIGSDFNLNSSIYENNSNGESMSLNNAGVRTDYYKTNTGMEGNFRNYGVSLYYTGKFDEKGRELNFDSYFARDMSTFDNKQANTYFDSLNYEEPDPFKQNTYTNNDNYNLKLQADYTHPYNDKIKFESGYKGNFKNLDNDYVFDTLNYTVNQFVTNYNLANRFKMNESINAMYVTFSHKISDFKYKLGLRAEYTHTKGDVVTTGQDFTKDYLDFFPTASVSQKAGLSNEFQLSYSRRITRPSPWRLNPFVNRYNTRYITYGNPEVTPEFTNSFELSHNYFSDVVSVTSSVFYRKSTDVISNYNFLLDSVTTVSTVVNGTTSQSYGADFIARSSALKWLSVNANLGLYNTTFEGNILNDYQGEEGFSWRGNIRAVFKIAELFNVELYYNYSGKRFNSNGYNEPMQNFDVSVNTSFINKKLTVGLRAEDIFETRKWESNTNGIGYTSNFSSQWNSRNLYLTLSYNFGNSDKFYTKSKKTKKNENENQDVQNNNQQ
ncbi:MAG: TonB-dependent receptor [Ignavibacteria bacterium]|nr:TonB-dependent receptor [Ignavibacteria bacterium]